MLFIYNGKEDRKKEKDKSLFQKRVARNSSNKILITVIILFDHRS